jgi:hypothetical protein
MSLLPCWSKAVSSAILRPRSAKPSAHPLVTDKNAWQRERPFRAAVIEQCTYDTLQRFRAYLRDRRNKAEFYS